MAVAAVAVGLLTLAGVGFAFRDNHPIDKVRELQRKLYMAAKLSPERRFHALFDRIWRGDVLTEAWRRGTLSRRSASIMRRPSVSRVREIRMHGLNGGLRKRTRSGHRA